MDKKIRVGILLGGKSPEHEVSLQSAKNVIRAIDKSKFDVVVIGIDKKGEWHLKDPENYLINDQDPKAISLGGFQESLSLLPAESDKHFLPVKSKIELGKLDVVFPVLHGINGEDGTIQGLLQLMGIPYVGCGVLSTAVCMDKDVTKRLLRDANIPVSKFLTVRKKDKAAVNYEHVKKTLGVPFFIKPANSGSSVGVSKVKGETDFKKAIEEAFLHDNKILIEEFIEGREIECAVLGNENPLASIPGEITPTHEYYSYEAKYIDPNGALLGIPAVLSDQKKEEVKQLALAAYQALECEGMARVDMFLKKDGSLYINEINTIPGFTNISMYPKLWEVSGIPYAQLIESLIFLALQRAEERKGLKTFFNEGEIEHLQGKNCETLQ